MDTIKLSTLKSNGRNPRKINADALKKLCESIERDPQFMELRPIVIDEDRMILGGNQRFRACQKLGMNEVPASWVKTASGLTNEQRRRFILVDNAPDGMAGEWDLEILTTEWQMPELGDLGFDLDSLLADVNAEPQTKNDVDAEPQVDRADELRDEWQVDPGQLWQLGDHRLLCGDSTKAENVARLMGGDLFQLLATSPPYAAQREYKIGAFDWDALMDGVFLSAKRAMQKSGSMLVNLGLVHKNGKVVRYWDNWIDRMEASGLPLYGWYVWDKLNGAPGEHHGRLAPSHEWVFHFANDPERARKTKPTKWSERGITHYASNKVGLRTSDGKLGRFTQAGKPVSDSKVIDSVIRANYAIGGVAGHPAPFSVEFISEIISSYTDANNIVYEPFSGSGTTLIACEQLGRKCRAIDIEPGYVAVALQRFKDSTGKQPELLLEDA